MTHADRRSCSPRLALVLIHLLGWTACTTPPTSPRADRDESKPAAADELGELFREFTVHSTKISPVTGIGPRFDRDFPRSLSVQGLVSTNSPLDPVLPEGVVVCAFHVIAARRGACHIQVAEKRLGFHLADFSLPLEEGASKSLVVGLRCTINDEAPQVDCALFELTESDPILLAHRTSRQKWLPSSAPQGVPRWEWARAHWGYILDAHSLPIALWSWNGRDSSVLAGRALYGWVLNLLGEMLTLPDSIREWQEPVVAVEICFMPES